VTVGMDALLRRRRRRKATAPTPGPVTSAEVTRPTPSVPGAVGTPTSGASAPVEADETVRIPKGKAVESSPPKAETPTSGVSAPVENDQTVRISAAKIAKSPPAKGPGATTAPVPADYQLPTAGSKPPVSTDADRAAGSPLELTADATVVLQRLPKPDWPVRNGEKKQS
jgi:hypothetical protein